MQYLISFLEGIVTFISPCLLPLLPVYVSYFAGGKADRSRALGNSLGFVLGFTLVFVLLGAFAGSLGVLLGRYMAAVNVVTGSIVVIFGLHFLGALNLGFLNASYRKTMRMNDLGFFSSVVFGVVFSVGWTPCVGAFLGSALLLASQQGSVWQGSLMLACYSLGLGIPFVASAVMIERLKFTFQWIKDRYDAINLFSGVLLVALGVMMMTGLMGYFLSIVS